MRGYVQRHQHQLFKMRRRRNPLDGEIYDYDPDSYNFDRIQQYLSNHPPAMRLASNDNFFIEDKVIRCMNRLPQIKLSAPILLSNLRKKVPGGDLEEDPS